MGIKDFFEPDVKTEQVGSKATKETQANLERGLLKDIAGRTVEFPTLQVPGLTDTEQQAQSVLANLLSGGTFQDPSSSKLYAISGGTIHNDCYY